MTETMLRTALGEKILRHWREHCPQMVRDLEQKNRLDEAVLEAQETTGDLLYELVSVKKMNYPAAWELATQEWALPQSGNQDETTSGDLPPPANPSGTEVVLDRQLDGHRYAAHARRGEAPLRDRVEQRAVQDRARGLDDREVHHLALLADPHLDRGRAAQTALARAGRIRRQ